MLFILEKTRDDLHSVPAGLREKETLELRKDFAFLFLTPHGVSPFESVYRGSQKLLMDKPWERVRGFYKKMGLEKDTEEIHPEDHAAVELGFLSTLAYLSSDRILKQEIGAEELEAQRIALLRSQHAFLQNHAARWIPELCKDIAAKARHRYTRDFAFLTGELVHLDLELLGKILQEREIGSKQN